nr:hypothetical protein Itr_chr07CG06320 [Ipomoea trifida]
MASNNINLTIKHKELQVKPRTRVYASAQKKEFVCCCYGKTAAGINSLEKANFVAVEPSSPPPENLPNGALKTYSHRTISDRNWSGIRTDDPFLRSTPSFIPLQPTAPPNAKGTAASIADSLLDR